MRTIPLGEARDRLEEIIANLSPGEEVAITRDDRPVAILRAPGTPPVKHHLGTPVARGVHRPHDPDLLPIPDELGGEA